MKTIRYFLEALLLHILFFFFGILPVEKASDIGGWIGRTIGPRLAASRKALRNLQMAMPELKSDRQKQIISEMWDNLGRVMAEYPHLEKIAKKYTEVKGQNILNDLFAGDTGAVFFGGHLANWEVNCAAMLKQFEKEVYITYRAPNNPWSDKLLMKARSLNGQLTAYPKSRGGGKDILEAIKQGRYLGILIDQKYNEGLSVPFFGVEAMTNPVFVQLCQKYGCPLIPVQGERLQGTRFRLTVYEPIKLFDENNQPLPIHDVIADAHVHLENWIKKNPGQWLWLHRRWDLSKV